MVKEAQFLGFGFTTNVSKNRKRKHPEWKYFSTEHPKKREKLKAELRKILDRKALGGIQLVKQKLQKKLRGWVNYFREVIPVTWRAEIDGWVRRRQRKIHWKQWKTPEKRLSEFNKRSKYAPKLKEYAYRSNRWWRMSQTKQICQVLNNNILL